MLEQIYSLDEAPSKALSSRFNTKHGIILIECESSTTFFMHLNPLGTRVVQNLSLCSFEWNRDSEVPLLCSSSSHGDIRVYKVPINPRSELTCITELHHLTLNSLINLNNKGLRIEKIRVISYRKDEVLLIIDSRLIVKLIIHESKPAHIVYQLDSPNQIIHVNLTCEIVTIIDTDYSILLYNYNNKSLISVVQRFADKYWNNCVLSDDYLYLYMLDSNSDLYCCYLDEYYMEKSSLLTAATVAPGKTSVESVIHWFSNLDINKPSTLNKTSTRTKRKETLCKLELEGDCLSYEQINNYITSIVFNKDEMFMITYDCNNLEKTSLRINSADIPVLSNSLTSPHFIITDRSLKAVLSAHFKIDKDSSLYEQLVICNQWGELRPTLNFLATALSNRSMELVSQYLHSHLTVLQEIVEGRENMDTITEICKLVITAVTTYNKHSTTVEFSQQLLQSTLTFLQNQSRGAVSLLNELLLNNELGKRPVVETFLEVITDQIISLKQHLQKKEISSRVTVSKTKLTEIQKLQPELSTDLINMWNKLTNQEVIGDAILMGNISLLQAYFKLQQRDSEADFDHIIKVGLECVITELEQRNWSGACQMLKNMGFGVFNKLSQICMFTTDHTLRSYLLSKLEQHGHFSETEISAVRLSQLLDQLYPNKSFNTTIKKISSKCDDRKLMSDSVSELVPDIHKYTGEITGQSPESLNSLEQSHDSSIQSLQSASSIYQTDQHYIYYMLNWVTDWLNYKDEIILERVMIDEELHDYLSDIPSLVVWSYLSRRNDLHQLLTWAKVQQEGDASDLNFQHERITDNMMKELQLSSVYTRETILNYMARHDRVLEIELTESSHYKRLARVDRLFPWCDSRLVQMEPVICYLVKHQLLDTLYFLYDMNRGEIDKKVLSSNLSGRDLLLVEMIESFNQLAHQSHDASSMVNTSLSVSKYLLRHPYLTLDDMIKNTQLHDHILCTLMYIQPFHPESGVTLSPESLEQLKTHPMLIQLLTDKNKQKQTKSLTLYTLLRKWGKINFDRLLSWQTNNELCETQSDEKMYVMADFSDLELSSKFSVNDRLDYMYYLLHSCGSYALNSFLSTELSLTSTLNNTRLSHAVKQAHFLSVKYYTQPDIVASCIMFVEMLGEDSTEMRLHYNICTLIHELYHSKQQSLNKSKSEDIESLMQPLLFGRKFTQKTVLELLEKAIIHNVNQSDINGMDILAIYKWSICVEYCNLYNLPHSVLFLSICAQENNWMSFLIYAQLYNIPVTQLHSTLMGFTNSNIKEHLQSVIENVITKSESELYAVCNVRTERHPKMNVLTRKKKRSNLISSSEDERNKPSHYSEPRETNLNYLKPTTHRNIETCVENIPDDIFSIMFTCSHHYNIWRILNLYSILINNPVLSVIAASYQESSSEECLLFWLLSQSKPDNLSSLVDMNTGFLLHRDYLLDIINLQERELLRTGLTIFIPDSVLIDLLDSFQYLHDHNFNEADKKLSTFKLNMNKMKSELVSPTGLLSDQLRARSISRSATIDGLTLHEVTSISWCIILKLTETLADYLLERFLYLVKNNNLNWIFSSYDANFSRGYHIYKIIYSSELIDIDIPVILSTSDEFNGQVQAIISQLLQKGLYDEARSVCKLCGVDKDEVSQRELERDVLSVSHQPGWLTGNHTEFWVTCNKKCSQLDISPQRSSKFFKKQAEVSCDVVEKAYLMDQSLFWLKQDHTALQSGKLDELQREVWSTHISAIIYQMNSGSSENDNSNAKLESLDKTQFLINNYNHQSFIHHNQSTRDQQSVKAVQILVDECLDLCKINEACLLCEEYSCTNLNLNIILACIELANSVITPASLHPSIHTLLNQESSTPNVQYRFKTTIRSLPSSANLLTMKQTQPDSDDSVLNTIKKLERNLKHGQLACQKIVICYQISQALEVPYKEIILQAEYSLLKILLASKIESRYKLCQMYIETSVLTENDIASFLSSTLTNTLKRAAHSNDDSDYMTEHEDIDVTSSELRPLVQLFHNAAVFGAALLESSAELNLDESQFTKQLSIEVDLLILAHDSYSVSYDMEGISNVLQACKKCVINLSEVKDYNKMVELLVGIGRFSEMIYIFDILKQNHQFELLFRKGIAKEDKLRLAVLDYLRRFCPGDNDTYRIVSSHFTMYREIAQLLQETATQQLLKFNKITDLTPLQLADIQKNLTDAAEIFIEGQCVRHAERCAKLARLICLQIQLLVYNIQVINLEPKQLRKFLIHHDRFHEVYIVSEAYGKSEWISAVCYNLLIKSDDSYFNDYKKTFTLSNSFFTDVLHRFLHQTEVSARSAQSLTNIKYFISSCHDVVHRFKLAREANITDLTVELLSREKSSAGIIRDTFQIPIS